MYLLTWQHHTYQVDDTTAAIWPAWNFVHHGTFMLDHFGPRIHHNSFVFEANGHWVSGRMMGAILSGVPVCALLAWTHLTPTDLITVNSAVLTAFTMTALCAMFRRVAPAGVAFCATMVMAFGTSLWSVAAAHSWPQTNDALWLALMLLAVSHERVWLAGFALLPALITRPHLACVALAMGVGLGLRTRSFRPVAAFGIPPVVAAALLLLWNHWYLGQSNFLGVYQAHTTALTGAGVGGVPYWEGALATFFSPSLGLLVLTPIAALAAVWMVCARRNLPAWSVFALVGGLGYEVLQLKVDVFTGGGGFFGGRLIIELVVLASPAAVACYAPWSIGHRGRRLLTTALASASLATFVIGARLPVGLFAVPTKRPWLTYYPFRSADSGPKAVFAAAMTILIAILFVLTRAASIWSSQPAAAVVAPRQPSDQEVVHEHQLN